MIANLSSGTKFNGKTLNNPSTPAARANAQKTASAPSRYSNSFFTRISPTFFTTSLKYACAPGFFTASLRGAEKAIIKLARMRRVFPRAGAYARDVKPPLSVCRRALGG